MSMLTHQIPFQVFSLVSFFQEVNPNPLQVIIRGIGEVFPQHGEKRSTSFALVDIPSLMQGPGELHAVIIPENVFVGKVMIFSRDQELGEILTVELKDGNGDEDLIGTVVVVGKSGSKRLQIFNDKIVYKKVKAHLELVSVDGRSVE